MFDSLTVLMLIFMLNVTAVAGHADTECLHCADGTTSHMSDAPTNAVGAALHFTVIGHCG